MSVVNIAVDGPAGAGTSTLSRCVSAALGYIYVDTGALYRAVGLYMLRAGIDTKDTAAVTAALGGVQVSLRFVDGEQRVLRAGEGGVEHPVADGGVGQVVIEIAVLRRGVHP